jgi:hypothetical protein
MARETVAVSGFPEAFRVCANPPLGIALGRQNPQNPKFAKIFLALSAVRKYIAALFETPFDSPVTRT